MKQLKARSLNLKEYPTNPEDYAAASFQFTEMQWQDACKMIQYQEKHSQLALIRK